MSMKKFIKNISMEQWLLLIILIFLAAPAFAADFQTSDGAKGVLDLFANILLKYALPFVISLGMVLFLVGMVRFVGAGDNEEKRASGRAVMIYGIIVLFVMVAAWGLVAIFTQTFTGSKPTLPNFLPPPIPHR